MKASPGYGGTAIQRRGIKVAAAFETRFIPFASFYLIKQRVFAGYNIWFDRKKKSQGFFTDHNPTRGSCHDVIQISRVEWGRIKRYFKISPDRSGRVKSGQEVVHVSWVGTGCPDST